MKSKLTYQQRVDIVVERDHLATANIARLVDLTDNRLRNAETPADEQRALTIDNNVYTWLVKAALRRHRIAQREGREHFNNGLTVGLDRVRVRIVNGKRV
jgi:hypothetical protein